MFYGSCLHVMFLKSDSWANSWKIDLVIKWCFLVMPADWNVMFLHIDWMAFEAVVVSVHQLESVVAIIFFHWLRCDTLPHILNNNVSGVHGMPRRHIAYSWSIYEETLFPVAVLGWFAYLNYLYLVSMRLQRVSWVVSALVLGKWKSLVSKWFAIFYPLKCADISKREDNVILKSHT